MIKTQGSEECERADVTCRFNAHLHVSLADHAQSETRSGSEEFSCTRPAKGHGLSSKDGRERILFEALKGLGTKQGEQCNLPDLPGNNGKYLSEMESQEYLPTSSNEATLQLEEISPVPQRPHLIVI